MDSRASDYFIRYLKLVDDWIHCTASDVPIVNGQLSDFTHPSRLVDYRQALEIIKCGKDVGNCGLHFFDVAWQMDDPLWLDLENNLDFFRKFHCVVAPPFRSRQLEAPFQAKTNLCDSRLIARLLQIVGVSVVPSVYWECESALQFCCDGLAQRNVISISTERIADEPLESAARTLFAEGCRKTARDLQPRIVLLYGPRIPELDVVDADVVEYPARIRQKTLPFVFERQDGRRLFGSDQE